MDQMNIVNREIKTERARRQGSMDELSLEMAQLESKDRKLIKIIAKLKTEIVPRARCQEKVVIGQTQQG